MSSLSSGSGWRGWLIVVCGWLACAFLCLALTVGLEAYPAAYDSLFPFVLLLLFGNVFAFLFVINRRGDSLARVGGAVLRLCVGEALLLAGLYCLGKYGLGA